MHMRKRFFGLILGAGVLAADGTLDRAELGQIIFGDDAARADLNQIIHPAVRARRAVVR